MDGSLGLRERKKIATAQALYDAAMRLSARDGFDNVTVEAVADAADVSRRTFSNYFASKEDAMLHGDRQRLEALLTAVAGRPDAESAWTALCRGTDVVLTELFRLHAERESATGPDWLARARLIRSHPALLSEQVATYASFERSLAEEISRRIPPERRSETTARVMAACFLGALRVGVQVWVDSGGGIALAGFVGQVLSEASMRFP